ncbi:MAG TPA: hypothetical protein VF281_00900 [Candidatus Saccharimonadales bacterium]
MAKANSPFVVALEGIPGSGKTSLRRTLFSTFNYSVDRVEQILPDDPDSDDDLTMEDIIQSDFLKTRRAKDDSYDIVILDRYYISTLVYQESFDQVYSKKTFNELSLRYKKALHEGDLIVPDLTIYIDTPLNLSFARKNRKSSDELWVNEKFLTLNRELYRKYNDFHYIDGTRKLDDIRLYIENEIVRRLND